MVMELNELEYLYLIRGITKILVDNGSAKNQAVAVALYVKDNFVLKDATSLEEY